MKPIPHNHLHGLAVSARHVLPQGPVETGKVKILECKRPSVLPSAALSFFAGFTDGRTDGLFNDQVKNKPSPKGSQNHVIASAIAEGRISYSEGCLRRKSGRPAKLQRDMHGYWKIGIFKAKFTAARVICWLVNGPPPFEEAQVDHINRIRSDDRPENLRWVTQSENNRNICPIAAKKRDDLLSRHNLRGERSTNVKLTRADVLAIRASNETQRILGERFGVDHTTISKIKRGVRWGEPSMHPGP